MADRSTDIVSRLAESEALRRSVLSFVQREGRVTTGQLLAWWIGSVRATPTDAKKAFDILFAKLVEESALRSVKPDAVDSDAMPLWELGPVAAAELKRWREST